MVRMITRPLKNEYFFPLGFISLNNCSYAQIFTVLFATCAGGSGAKQGENMTELQNTIADILTAVLCGALLTVGALAYFDILFF
jgi:hypothetical protein